jgi:hypothetical protein
MSWKIGIVRARCGIEVFESYSHSNTEHTGTGKRYREKVEVAVWQCEGERLSNVQHRSVTQGYLAGPDVLQETDECRREKNLHGQFGT